MPAFDAQLEAVSALEPARLAGVVDEATGLTLEVCELRAPIGALVRVRTNQGETALGEVIGFDRAVARVMMLTPLAGVRSGDRVELVQSAQRTIAGEGLLGRVVDGLGRPMDGQGPVGRTRARRLEPAPISALERGRIRAPMASGVRSIDVMATLGRGQRVGLFAGPGVGKSTLLGMIARESDADVNVIGLIGERGREVREFIEDVLGEEGRRRSVVVVATGDETPPMRVRAAMSACAIAEAFRDTGADVMLLMDSITRFAHAQRQIGLGAGEMPATKGYTPSVFARLSQVLERAGPVEGGGSITGLYTVLVEGDEATDPVADAARGVLDGHVSLSRRLAQRSHFPAVDVLASVSRVADAVSPPKLIEARRTLVRLMAAYAEVEELVQIGAYARGSNPVADVAIDLRSEIDALLMQNTDERTSFDTSVAQATQLAATAREKLGAADKATA